MSAALDAFQAPPTAARGGESAPATAALASEDAAARRLRESGVRVQQPRDALFAALHALLLEAGETVEDIEEGIGADIRDGNAGFEAPAGSKDTFALPSGWDANSASGLITASYKHENDTSIEFNVQVRSRAIQDT